MKWSGPCKTASKSSASTNPHFDTYAFAARKMCSQRVVTLVMCMLMPGWLAAQTTDGSPIRAHDDTYVIGLHDVLSINVWKEPEISRTVPVRSDGKISLPLVGKVQASGETLHQLEKDLATKLQSFISKPEVIVIVTEIKGQKFNIPGQLNRPGSYPLPNSPAVLLGTDLPLLLPWRSLHG
jgi:protein involved in polysaccharide export with SLBB domain